MSSTLGFANRLDCIDPTSDQLYAECWNLPFFKAIIFFGRYDEINCLYSILYYFLFCLYSGAKPEISLLCRLTAFQMKNGLTTSNLRLCTALQIPQRDQHSKGEEREQTLQQGVDLVLRFPIALLSSLYILEEWATGGGGDGFSGGCLFLTQHIATRMGGDPASVTWERECKAASSIDA